jgi:hypothetical protein
MIAGSAYFHRSSQSSESPTFLQLSQLKSLFMEANMRVDRREFIVEQHQTTMRTCRRGSQINSISTNFFSKS